jgi:hypothetical protein
MTARKQTKAVPNAIQRSNLDGARASPQRVCEVAVSDTVESLIVDLVEWIGPGCRPYAEVLEAWKTSCPRLPVWEEANDRGLIERRHAPGAGASVALSATGRALLYERR